MIRDVTQQKLVEISNLAPTPKYAQIIEAAAKPPPTKLGVTHQRALQRLDRGQLPLVLGPWSKVLLYGIRYWPKPEHRALIQLLSAGVLRVVEVTGEDLAPLLVGVPSHVQAGHANTYAIVRAEGAGSTAYEPANRVVVRDAAGSIRARPHTLAAAHRATRRANMAGTKVGRALRQQMAADARENADSVRYRLDARAAGEVARAAVATRFPTITVENMKEALAYQENVIKDELAKRGWATHGRTRVSRSHNMAERHGVRLTGHGKKFGDDITYTEWVCELREELLHRGIADDAVDDFIQQRTDRLKQMWRAGQDRYDVANNVDEALGRSGYCEDCGEYH